jgi:hypothetical protein
MMRSIYYGFCLLIFSVPGFACDDIEALYALESATLLKNAPTFKHGWEDKTIQLHFSDVKTTAEGCMATMQLTLPQQDLDEINAEINQTKRTELAIKGYEVPKPVNRVVYYYQVKDGQVLPNTELNHALKRLHESVEYMYQSLAQQRIALKKGIKNPVTWDDSLKQTEMAHCRTHYIVTVGNLDFACTCRVDNLSRIMSPRQIELAHFMESPPSPAAAEALNAYLHSSKKINDDCNNLTKKTPDQIR